MKRVQAAGGYVAESSLYESSLSMVVKIPAAKFDTFVDSTGDLGKILSRQISVEDVTQRYYDLENRIKNKRILVQRLQSYLSSANKIEDLLKIERELSDATTELESLEASFKNLSHLISYSTLSIGFRLPDYESGALNLPSLRSGFRGLAESVVKFLYVLLFIVIGLIVFGIPTVLVLGVLYLVTFGKVGLVKRYFGALGARIGKRKKPEPGSDG